MKPSVFRRQDTLQLTYDVPHRIFASQVYNCRSPNGSTIILYGHDEGVRILWRGGKAFKKSTQLGERSKVNGAASHDNMVVDLDDDEPERGQASRTIAEFEDEDEEVDPSEPFQQVLRTIDIPFGCATQHIAIPHVPVHVVDTPGAYPPIYSSHIVFAAACADLSVRLIVLPLTPPSPESVDSSTWGLQVVKLGSNPHQDQLSSITITHTASLADSDEEGNKSASRSRSQSGKVGSGAKTQSSKGSLNWSFLIASTSNAAGGLLAVHQIPLTSDNSIYTSTDSHTLLQRQHIRLPSAKTRISFNTSPYPAEKHSNILITCPDSGCVKIYQTLPEFSSTSRGRRGSAATIDSATSSSRSLRLATNPRGKVLLTLYPGFVDLTDSAPVVRRKHIIDASWVLEGRAILVLLEAGEWGVWDIEGAGPSSSQTQSLFKGQDTVCGIQGGALTKFSLRGVIEPPAEDVQKTQRVDTRDARTGTLAPMTPHTRKMRSDGLFRGSGSKLHVAATHGVFTQGSICVNEHPPSRASAGSTSTNESVLLSYGNTNLFIPSLLSLWRAETTGKGSLDTSSILRPSPFTALQLGGEQQRATAALPRSLNTTSTGLFGLSTDRSTDILIATERQLILLVSPISEPSSSSLNGPASRMSSDMPPEGDVDQLLLTHGDLDIDGMDRIMDNMTNGTKIPVTRFGKSVGFDLDDDGDIATMGTPTPKNTMRRPKGRATPAALRTGRKGQNLFT